MTASCSGKRNRRGFGLPTCGRGVTVSPVDHGISKALYFTDPDGNGLEAYLDTREANDQMDWHGRNDPFDPTAP